MEDLTGEDIEFFDVSVLRTDDELIKGGPQRIVDRAQAQKEGENERKFAQRVIYTHDEFKIEYKQKCTVIIN